LVSRQIVAIQVSRQIRFHLAYWNVKCHSFVLNGYNPKLLSLLAISFKHNKNSRLLKKVGISLNSVRSIEANINKLKNHFNTTDTTNLLNVTSILGPI